MCKVKNLLSFISLSPKCERWWIYYGVCFVNLGYDVLQLEIELYLIESLIAYAF